MKVIETAIELELEYATRFDCGTKEKLKYVRNKIQVCMERQLRLYDELIKLEEETTYSDNEEYLNQRNRLRNELRNISTIISTYAKRI